MPFLDAFGDYAPKDPPQGPQTPASPSAPPLGDLAVTTMRIVLQGKQLLRGLLLPAIPPTLLSCQTYKSIFHFEEPCLMLVLLICSAATVGNTLCRSVSM